MTRKPSEPNTSVAAPSAGAAADESLARAVREALAPQEARLSQDAARAFSNVHARLMEGIDRSRQDEGLDLSDLAQHTAPSEAPASTWRPHGAHVGGAESISVPSVPSVSLDSGVRRSRRALAPAASAGAPTWSWRRRVSAAARYGAAACLLSAAVVGGHTAGRQSGPEALPVRSIVADYASGLGPGAPLEVSARSEGDTSRWMSQRLGRRVSLPTASRVGGMLLGARRCTVSGRDAAQAHYLKDGARVALYQIHAPHLGLSGLGEVRSGGRSYFTQQVDGCSLIAWRADEDIMAVVAPFELPASLSLAHSMREPAPLLSALSTGSQSRSSG